MRKHAYIPTDIVYYKHTEVDTDIQAVVRIMEVHVSNDCKNKIYMLYYCIRIQSKLYQKEENMGKGGSDVEQVQYEALLCSHLPWRTGKEEMGHESVRMRAVPVGGESGDLWRGKSSPSRV